MKTAEELAQAFSEFKQARTDAEAGLKELIQAKDKDIATISAKMEEVCKKVEASATQLLDMEQKTAKAVLRGQEAPKSLGQFVVDSNEYKAFASTEGKHFILNTKRGFVPQANTVTGQAGSPPANSDILVQPDRMAGIISGAFRALRVEDVIPSGKTNSNMVEYTRELLFTNNAAETAEGAQKPESILTFELANAPVATIAHFIKVSKQVFDDSPLLASYIDNRMRYGVDYRVDGQLINGNGVGQNIKGLAHSDNRTAFTPKSGHTVLDSINFAKEKIAKADYVATAVFLNPEDWGKIERLKDKNEHYLVGDPFGAIIPVLWGMPVVVTNAMTAGKLLVGAMNVAAQIFNREGVTVELTGTNDDDFTKNLLTLRAERRMALAGLRPASILYGNITI